MSIESNLRRVNETIAQAAERAGRAPSDVRLIGVSKTVGRREVDEAYAAGLRDFGENRVQDAKAKFTPPLPPDATLHLIGYLQTNKAKDAAALFDYVHSIDRLAIIEALNTRAAQLEKRLKVLVQVNIAGEEQKHGCEPEEAAGLVRAASECSQLEVVGLMTIAPLSATAEETRPVFRGLRELRDRLAESTGLALPELSMGMTNDYAVAIEEGATMIRVGRAIFQS
ncbi:MAG TPA: YggS family pyridoxal phosphate-dependent enzyme [Thermomicrobiaceae bacterium]|nr:YggS family pyridoxal phosphate-dependent enzyme [Thermomicrobiaceae bacterium]